MTAMPPELLNEAQKVPDAQFWGPASQRSYRILGRVPQSGAQSHLSGSNRDGLLQTGG